MDHSRRLLWASIAVDNAYRQSLRCRKCLYICVCSLDNDLDVTNRINSRFHALQLTDEPDINAPLAPQQGRVCLACGLIFRFSGIDTVWRLVLGKSEQ